MTRHSGRGSEYILFPYNERLAEAGIEPSVRSQGNSYHEALAKNISSLYEAELVHRPASRRMREAVEWATLQSVSWINRHQLM